VRFDFGIASDMTFNRRLFYLVATRELIPAGWRWLGRLQPARRTGAGLVYIDESLRRVFSN
jgi:hypothetical protein